MPTKPALPPTSRPRSAAPSMSSATSRRRSAARISPICCRPGRGRCCGSAMARARAAASCTTPATISTTARSRSGSAFSPASPSGSSPPNEAGEPNSGQFGAAPLPSSPGLTRGSMDGRVKPGHDEGGWMRDRRHRMRVHVVNFLRPDPDYAGRTLDYLSGLARQVEARGFAGLWLTDSFGRGRPTLDPIVGMSVVAAVTSRIEIGTCVLQVPVRHPVELAHRIESLYALAGSRLQLGVGSGSTQADFDLVGQDYAQRFKLLMSALDTMGTAWRGERLPGGILTPWPGTEGGPNVLLGAWRNKRWIVYAAEQCAGWIASGLYSQPEELASGMKIYRDAGGKRAILSNVIVALEDGSEAAQRALSATVTLTGGAAAALDRLKRIRDVGFDDVLCMTPLAALDDLERLRDAVA